MGNDRYELVRVTGGLILQTPTKTDGGAYSRRARAGWRGALRGILPGAILAVSYACIRMAARGELAAVGYEIYILPTNALAGCITGFGTGLWVGWILGGLSAWRLATRICLLMAHGAVIGILFANVLLCAFWLTMDEGPGTGTLVELNLAGIIIGTSVAVAVGMRMTLHANPLTVAKDSAGLD
jgi:hypothetical protein